MRDLGARRADFDAVLPELALFKRQTFSAHEERPRLAEPRTANEAEKWAHVMLSYYDELHQAFEDLRYLEETEQKRLQSPGVIARKVRFAELSARNRELLR
jgi:hypothetical protein